MFDLTCLAHILKCNITIRTEGISKFPNYDFWRTVRTALNVYGRNIHLKIKKKKLENSNVQLKIDSENT